MTDSNDTRIITTKLYYVKSVTHLSIVEIIKYILSPLKYQNKSRCGLTVFKPYRSQVFCRRKDASYSKETNP